MGNYLVYIRFVGKPADVSLCDKKTAHKLFEEHANDAGEVDSIWIGKVVKQYWRGKETRQKLFGE